MKIIIRKSSIIHFVLVLLFPLILNAQSNSSIDLVFGAEYSYRSLSTDSNLDVLNTIVELRNSEVRNKNLRFGFNYNKSISNRFIFKTGLRFSSVGFKTARTDLRWGTGHDGMGGFDPTLNFDPSLADRIELSTNYWFVELPLLGRLSLGKMDKKLNPFIEFGISPSYMISIRNKSKTNIETVTEFGEIVDQINRIHLIGNGAIGLNYKLKKQLQVFGQSVVRYHFTNLYKSDLQTNLYNYGLEIGIRRMLN